MKIFKKGFTLIELLIVIAILGVLAVALLAALDPLEQIKKGQDTATSNTAAEVLGATTRFYANSTYMPWCADYTCTSAYAGLSSQPPPAGTVLQNYQALITRLIAVGELKSSFSQAAGAQMNYIYITGSNNPAGAVVCFNPKSKSMLSNQNTQFDNSGNVVAGCPGPTTCYWCIR